jgi:hypothetical protein
MAASRGGRAGGRGTGAWGSSAAAGGGAPLAAAQEEVQVNTGGLHVSQHLTTSADMVQYSVWRSQIEMLMRARGYGRPLLADPAPEEGTSERTSYDRQNQACVAIVANSIDRTLVAAVASTRGTAAMNDVHHVLAYIDKFFAGQIDEDAVAVMIKQLEALKLDIDEAQQSQDPSVSIRVFMLNQQASVGRLATAVSLMKGDKDANKAMYIPSEAKQISTMLAGLAPREKWTNGIGRWRNKPEGERTLDNFWCWLMAEWRLFTFSPMSVASRQLDMAAAASEGDRFTGVCHSCKLPGHKAIDCTRSAAPRAAAVSNRGRGQQQQAPRSQQQTAASFYCMWHGDNNSHATESCGQVKKAVQQQQQRATATGAPAAASGRGGRGRGQSRGGRGRGGGQRGGRGAPYGNGANQAQQHHTQQEWLDFMGQQEEEQFSDACWKARDNNELTHEAIWASKPQKAYLDSMATRTLCGDLTLMSKIRKLQQPLTFATASQGLDIQATHEGEVQVVFKKPDGSKAVMSQHAVYAPDLAQPLLSVPELNRIFDIMFSQDGTCKMYKDDNLHSQAYAATTTAGDTVHYFYLLPAAAAPSIQDKAEMATQEDHNEAKQAFTSGNLPATSSSTDEQLTSEQPAASSTQQTYGKVHARLSHASRTITRRTQQMNGMKNFPAIKIPEAPCHPCMEAKSRKQPMKQRKQYAKSQPQQQQASNGKQQRHQALHRLYVDLHFFQHPQQGGGWKGWQAVVDTGYEGSSGMTFVQLFSNKDQAVDKLIALSHRLHNLTGQKVQFIVTDSGTEYIKSAMHKWADEQGIEHTPTPPYTQSANGPAEQISRTLSGMARASRIASGLPSGYDAVFLVAANHVYNRLVHAGQTVSPFEKMYGRKPDYKHLRVMGSLCFVHIPEELRESKAHSARARMAILVGYHAHKRAYIVWDPTSKRLQATRDLQIDERPQSGARHFNYIVQDGHAQGGVSTAPAREGVMLDASHAFAHASDTHHAHTTAAAEAPAPAKKSTLACKRTDWAPIAQRLPARAVKKPFTPPQPAAEPQQAAEAAHAQQDSAPATAATAQQSVAPPPAAEADSDDDAPSLDYVLKHSRHKTAYLEAAVLELDSLMDAGPNQTPAFNVVDAQEGDGKRRHLVDARWVFKRKRDRAGVVYKTTARLAVRGFLQRYGHEYNETAASVAAHTTLRVMCALAAHHRTRLRKYDAVKAYQRSPLPEDEKIFIKIPPLFAEWARRQGIVSQAGQLEGKALQLVTAWQGTKQASRLWQQIAAQILLACKFKRCVGSDENLYTRSDQKGITFAAVVVDDIFVLDTHPGKHANRVMAEVVALAKADHNVVIKEVCDPDQQLVGIEVDYHFTNDVEGNYVLLHQTNYAQKMLHEARMQDCKPASTPLPPGCVLSSSDSPKTAEELMAMSSYHESYRKMVGQLVWLHVTCRPDIAFATGYLSRFLSAPGRKHWEALRHVFRYIKGTPSLGIKFLCGGDTRASAYVDSDWGGCVDTRRSVCGFFIMWKGGPIAWHSKRNQIVTGSAFESEFVALDSAGKAVVFTRQLLKDVGLEQPGPTPFFEDNQEVIRYVKGGHAFKTKSKHIDVRYRKCMEWEQDGIIAVEYCPTERQLADALTKPVAHIIHNRLMLGAVGMAAAVKLRHGQDTVISL